jgi:hypothetical protein
MSTHEVTDIEFLAHEVARREHFLYVYKKPASLLRSKVRDRVKAFAEKEGWEEKTPDPESSLNAELEAPSLWGEMFLVCDAADFKLEDLKDALSGMARSKFPNHVLLMVREGSRVLEQPEWFQAKDAVGVIEEPTVTIGNYRSVTRYLLRMSDLIGVQHLGEDERFLARMKAFVQERGRSPFETSMEIDRVVLTELRDGVLLEPRRVAERQERQVLSERLNQFLDDRSTATLHPLLRFVSDAFLSGNEPYSVLARLFRASASIVAGRDQRYKRNREGNPAVLPYLAWGMLVLTREAQLLEGNFVVAFDHLCHEYHSAAKDPSRWFVDAPNWQRIAKHLEACTVDEPSNLDKAREELRSALAARLRELPNMLELSWLLPLVMNAQDSPIVENA